MSATVGRSRISGGCRKRSGHEFGMNLRLVHIYIYTHVNIKQDCRSQKLIAIYVPSDS